MQRISSSFSKASLPKKRRHTLPASEFRNLTLQDALSVFEIEREAFVSVSGECPLTLDKVLKFLDVCPELSLGWFEEGQLVAFIIGSGWDKNKLSQEAMTHHIPDTPTVHIHVLSVHRDCRQQGKGSILLWRYLQYLHCLPGLSRVLLICEEFLVPFYLKAGFKNTGPSTIAVSSMHFQEMEYRLCGQAYARRNSANTADTWKSRQGYRGNASIQEGDLGKISDLGWGFFFRNPYILETNNPS